MNTTCPICETSADYSLVGGDLHGWRCARCGEFELTGSAESELRAARHLRREILSGWVRNKNMGGSTPKIRSGMEQFANLEVPPFKERLERYLLRALELSPTLDTSFHTSALSLLAASYCGNEKEIGIINGHLPHH